MVDVQIKEQLYKVLAGVCYEVAMFANINGSYICFLFSKYIYVGMFLLKENRQPFLCPDDYHIGVLIYGGILLYRIWC